MLVRYSSIDAANTSIDTKSNALAAIESALLIFAAESLKNNFNQILLLGVLLLVLGIILAIFTVRIVDSNNPVHLHSEMPGYYHKSDIDFVRQLIGDIEHAIQNSDNNNLQKAKFYNIGLSCFIVAGASIIISRFIDFNFIILVM